MLLLFKVQENAGLLVKIYFVGHLPCRKKKEAGVIHQLDYSIETWLSLS